MPESCQLSCPDAPRARVDIALGERSYSIYIGPQLLQDAALLEGAITARKLLIVTNETIAPLYLQQLRAVLPQRQIASVILPDGEQHKTLQSFAAIIDALIRE